MAKYLTAPLPSTKMPRGVPYIISNEAAERFSFYGMRSILVIFMTKYLVDRGGDLDVMSADQATVWYHSFVSAVYYTPILGALLADIFLGKYRTIISLSIVYCLGHLALALDDTRVGLALGLTLIAIGSGGIKSCVSAHVGDQFGQTNQHLIEKVFRWFYFSINLGSAASTLLIPLLLDRYGPHVAFGVPGLLMFVATVCFWAGRHQFVHIPPGGVGFVQETFSGEGVRALLKLCVLYLFVAMFWALFDQTGSRWVLQAEKMDRTWLGHEWLSSQIQAANPILIMLLIPAFSLIVYPAVGRVFPLTPLRRISIGFFVAALAFAIPALIETQITGGSVVKVSSSSTLDEWSPTRVLDGRVDGLGWSSGEAPAPGRPQELVIRLRERRPWSVARIELNAATQLTEAEILDVLARAELDTRKQLADARRRGTPDADLESLRDKRSSLASAQEQAAAADDVQTALTTAKEAFAVIEHDARALDAASYRPREITVYVADLRNRSLPKLIAELDKQEQATATDPRAFASAQGWQPVGEATQEISDESAEFEFEPTVATHLLVQIHSNHAAPRVKIAEVRALTDASLRSGAALTAADPRPNVAAVGYKPNIGWQLLAYVVMTAAEILISITCLEFSYTQAPKKMKSFIMGLYMGSIALGNSFTWAVNLFIQNEDGTSKLEGASYYWFFTGAVFVAGCAFIVVAMNFRERTYIHEERPRPSEGNEPVDDAGTTTS